MKNKFKNNWKERVENSKSRDYDFDTISGDRIDLLYSPDNTIDFENEIVILVNIHIQEEFILICIEENFGQCGSSQVLVVH